MRYFLLELQTDLKDFLTGNSKGQQSTSEGPKGAKMAAPVADAGEFESWLNDRLDSLEVDREVYGAYILGVLQEEETDEEIEDALQGILSAFLVIKHSGMYPSSLSHWLRSDHGRHAVGVLIIALRLYGKYGSQTGI